MPREEWGVAQTPQAWGTDLTLPLRGTPTGTVRPYPTPELCPHSTVFLAFPLLARHAPHLTGIHEDNATPASSQRCAGY